MATDPNPELRAEWEAALTILTPKKRGLQDLTQQFRSDELIGYANARLAEAERWESLLNAAIATLDATVAAIEALEEVGYPNFEPTPLPQNLFDELQMEVSDFQAGAGTFVVESAQAVRLEVEEDPPMHVASRVR